MDYIDEENLPKEYSDKSKKGAKILNSLNSNEILTFPAEATRTKVRVHGLIYHDDWLQKYKRKP